MSGRGRGCRDESHPVWRISFRAAVWRRTAGRRCGSFFLRKPETRRNRSPASTGSKVPLQQRPRWCTNLENHPRLLQEVRPHVGAGDVSFSAEAYFDVLPEATAVVVSGCFGIPDGLRTGTALTRKALTLPSGICLLSHPSPPLLGSRPRLSLPRWSAALLLQPQQSISWWTWQRPFSPIQTLRWWWWTGSSPPCTRGRHADNERWTRVITRLLGWGRWPGHGAVGAFSHREDVGFHVGHVLPAVGINHLLSVYGELVIRVDGH